MINLYIDESGSMTPNSEKYKQHFFVVCLIRVKNAKVLKRNYKRFVSSNLKTLKKVDDENRMFINDKFVELKGSAMNGDLKRRFVHSIIKGAPFEVYYIKLLNKQVKPKFLDNKARAFNYLLRLFFKYYNHKLESLQDDAYFLQIDERNVKTQSKYTLEEYLNTELSYEDDIELVSSIKVQYFDSINNKFIQIADVFANIYYSQCLTNAYNDIFDELKDKGIIKEANFFTFPPKNLYKNIDN